MTRKTNNSSSQPSTGPATPTSSNSSEKLVTEEEVDEILKSDKPKYTSRERATLDRYLIQKGFVDTTEEMIGKASVTLR